MSRRFMKLMPVCAWLVVGLIGCGGEEDETRPSAEAPPERSGAEEELKPAAQAVHLTGCLQQSDGEFVLTVSPEDVAVEEPEQPQAAQLEAAREAYRLSGAGDQFAELLGTEIEVMGVVEDAADLPTLQRPPEGEGSNARPLDIDAAELAELNVQTVSSTGQPCAN